MGDGDTMQCFQRCSSLTFRSTDTKDDRAMKSVIAPALVIFQAVSLFIMTVEGRESGGELIFAAHLYIVAAIATLLLMLKTPLSRWVPRLFPLIYVVGLLVDDLVMAARLTGRSWSVIVLLLDLCLILDLPDMLSKSVIAVVLLYGVAERSEAAVRYGMYDVALPDGLIHLCDCSNPPCAQGIEEAIGPGLEVAVVLLLDFAITRKYARQTRSQLRTIQATVDVSEKVAAHLSRYEVEAAEEAVAASAEQLPAPMLESYRRLVANLKFYRRFLPQSCLLAGDDDEAEDTAVSPSPLPLDASRPRRRTSAHNAGTPSPCESHSSPTSSRRADTPDTKPIASPTGPHSAAEVRKKRVALLCTNRTGFLDSCRVGGLQELQEWVAEDVGGFATDVATLNGCVDQIAGDHRFASFGAVRSCTRSANRAVTCAARGRARSMQEPTITAFRELALTSAVVFGLSVCGDFGSNSLQRFMVIGGLPVQLTVLERLAAKWRVPVLIGESVRDEVHVEWECAAVGLVVYEKRGSAQPMAVFTLRETRSPHGHNEEWMYTMDKSRVGESSAHGRPLVTVLADVGAREVELMCEPA